MQLTMARLARVACGALALLLLHAPWSGPAQAQAAAPAAAASAPAAPVPLLTFLEPFGVEQAAISPDGRHVALIENRGTLRTIKVVELADNSARVLNLDRRASDGRWLRNRSPRRVLWINSQWLAVDFGWAAEAVDLKGATVAELGTRVIGKAVPADLESTLMLVHDDTDFESVAVVDAATRRKQRLRYPMSGQPLDWTFDDRGALRAVLLAETAFWRDDTALKLWYLPIASETWVLLETFKVSEEMWQPLAASSKRDELIIASRQGRDTRAIFRMLPLQREQPPVPVFEHPQDDVQLGENPRGHAPMSFYTLGLKPQRRWLDDAWNSVQIAIDQYLPGRVNILSGNPEGKVLVLSYADTDPGRWYVLDVPREHATWLASVRQEIDAKRMRPMRTLRYAATDGLSIPAYLTLPAPPPGGEPRSMPTVVLVHGGPAARDHWGWDVEAQLLASRGYVVFQPQFRGSTGFGRAFEWAGRGQWGLAMQDDITAGVRHLVAEGIADPRRICIVGASYGGYAAVWGLIKTPELYRCGVSLAGVSDIGHMLTDWSDTNRSKMSREWMRRTVGDRRRDQAAFDAVSPLKHAARINAPLLIAHGDEDERVPISHAHKLMSAMDRAGKPYEWLPLPGEGHGIGTVSGQTRYYEKLLRFLDQHLGSAGR
jgi:dipeptidyl aminopeptidase/acylaminoacyl peptidase